VNQKEEERKVAMASEEDKFKVSVFDGTNYSNWKFQIEMLSDEKELLKYIQKPLHDILAEFNVLQADSPAEKDRKERQQVTIRKYDKKCKNLIVQRNADSYLECVKEKATAYEVWEVLQNTFERKSMAKQICLKHRLLTFKFNPATETLDSHFIKFDAMIRELKAAGATMEEYDVVVSFTADRATQI
jgi:hypothetical protein